MFTSFMMLAAEASGVVALRMMKLMRVATPPDPKQKVREKADAALEERTLFGRKNSPIDIENGLRRMRSD